jgi:hypothetical protein
MPTTKTKTTKTTKKGTGLTKKVGPVPLYFYLIGVAIVVLYLYYRHRNYQTDSTAGSQNQTVIPSGIVVPASSSTGNDNQGSQDGSTTYPTDYATETDLQSAIDSVNSNTAAAIAGITFPSATTYITVPTTGGSSPAATTTKSKTAAKNAEPFGGVLRTVKTKAGGTLTYYKSGRITEQVPGKSAYVVHK